MTPETQLFGVFHHVPLGIALSFIALVLIASFFITSADSATFVLGMQTTFGSLEPSSLCKSNMGCFSIINRIHLITSGGGNGADALNAIQSRGNYKCVPILLCSYNDDD